MAWENDLIRATNEIARLSRRGGRRALTRAARELCTAYSNLLTDAGFAQAIRQTLPSSPAPGATALRSHVNTAIALLVEAGVDGALAVDALHSIDDLLTSGPVPSISQGEFFKLLRNAKDAACELSGGVHGERTRRILRGLAVAGVGLVLVVLPVTAVAAPVLAAATAAVGPAAIPVVITSLQAIGAAIFVEGGKVATTAPGPAPAGSAPAPGPAPAP
jgi:hypothetical protein